MLAQAAFKRFARTGRHGGDHEACHGPPSQEHAMPILTTVTFRFVTAADAGIVWRRLTEAPRHFQGLALQSDWQPGSLVRLTSGIACVAGEVLHRRDDGRLSYTLGDHPSRPEVYVTWTLTPEDCGTIVDLCIDEVASGRYGIDGRPEEVDEIREAWQPVVDALRAEIDVLLRS
jgi:hypothetical protein